MRDSKPIKDREFPKDRNLVEDRIVSFAAEMHEKRVDNLARIDAAIEALKSAEKTSGIVLVRGIFLSVSRLLGAVKVPSLLLCDIELQAHAYPAHDYSAILLHRACIGLCWRVESPRSENEWNVTGGPRSVRV